MIWSSALDQIGERDDSSYVYRYTNAGCYPHKRGFVRFTIPIKRCISRPHLGLSCYPCDMTTTSTVTMAPACGA